MQDAYVFDVQGVAVTVSIEDAERVKRWSWWLTPGGYIKGHVEGRPMLLHHFIIGRPASGYVIDHLNLEKTDNRRENLRFATHAQNSQNRAKASNKSSVYRGVYWSKAWRCEVGGFYGGKFDTEIQAAKQADTLTLTLYGKHARTNGVLSELEIHSALSSVVPEKKKRDLPDRVCYDKHTKHKPYYVIQRINGQRRRKFFATISEAEKFIKDFEQQSRPCPEPYIITKCGAKVLIDEQFHGTFYNQIWSLTPQGYVQNSAGKLMHRIILGAEKGQIVDHISGVRTNNRLCNLRITTFSGNSQNKKKKSGCSSQYIGVYLTQGKWRAYIKHDYKTYALGMHLNEEDAGRAYDKKALELYDNPKLNFPITQ